MRTGPRVLLVGTADTKSAELLFLRERIESRGGQGLIMDVGVLGRPCFVPEVANHEVAEAAGTTLFALSALNDENAAMTAMASGASRLASRLHADGRIDGMLALGGTMGTDLGLEVAAALPLGVPKVLLSTVAHSHLLPPERIPADLICMLWAGGLYGLNPLCRSALSQAAGAVVGACEGAMPPRPKYPLIGITSLGSTVLRYMKTLLPALEKRGYEVVVFHSSGMGGQAFEDMASKGHFAAVFDFCQQELVNSLFGSCVTSGPNRLLSAGRAGVPQLVAPGAVDMVDFQAWAGVPVELEGQAVHVHNRLVGSVTLNAEQRRHVAHEIAKRLAQSSGPTCLLLPTDGVEEWDRDGGPMHNPPAHHALIEALRSSVRSPVEVLNVAGHINDPVFCTRALEVFDLWVREGRVAPGLLSERSAKTCQAT